MKRLILCLLCSAATVFGQVSSVQVDPTGNVIGPSIVNFATGGLKVNGVNVGGGGSGTVTSVSVTAPLTSLPNPIINSGTISITPGSFEVPLTFSQSLVRAVNDVTLLNDSASPGNSRYYGTNSGGTKGWFALPAGGSGTVTDFSAGNLSPLFTTTEATTTTTPALSFALDTTSPATSVYGRAAGTIGTASFSTAPQFLKIGNLTTNGFVKTGSADGTLSIDTATYLTANQNISLTGDVTGGPAATSIATTIGNNKVTLAMMGTMATDSILGRKTAATGNVEVLTALPWALTGDVTTVADANATTIAANAVTYGKMQAVSAVDKLLGSSHTTTPVQEITLGTNLSMSGTTLNATGGGGSGDVVGPASATDTAIARFNTTTGKLIQNSGITVDASNNVSGFQRLSGSGSGNYIGWGDVGFGDILGTNASTINYNAANAIKFRDNVGNINFTFKSPFASAVASLGSGYITGWSSTSSSDGTVDTALARNGVGIVEINNGTAANYRDLYARNITLQSSGIITGSGTVPTGGTTGQQLTKNSNTDYDVGWAAAGGGGGSGDVVGPAGATDNAIVRFDTTTGKLVQDSVVTIADTTGVTSNAGTAPAYNATGAATNIPLSINSKGNGWIGLAGSNTNGSIANLGASSGLNVGWNFSGLNGEADFLNSFTGNGEQFRFVDYQGSTLIKLYGANGGTYGAIGVGSAPQPSTISGFYNPSAGLVGWNNDTALGRNAAGVVEVNSGTAGTYRDILARGLRSNAVTFANAIAGAVEGTQQAFTDATSNIIGTTVTGGGSNHVLGYYNGTNWVVSSGPSGVEAANTVTLTNKRINPRVSTSATGNTTPTPNGDTDDQYVATGMTVNMVFGAPTGTPVDGQELIIRIKDSGAARTLGFNAIYRFSTDMIAPTTTVISKTMYLGFIYNGVETKWDNVAQMNNL